MGDTRRTHDAHTPDTQEAARPKVTVGVRLAPEKVAELERLAELDRRSLANLVELAIEIGLLRLQPAIESRVKQFPELAAQPGLQDPPQLRKAA